MNSPVLPEQTPEDAQKNMRETRAHMVGQMHALEDKVAGMIQGAADAVEGMSRGVRSAVHTAAEQVRGAPEFMLASIRDALDVRRHVRRYPWLAVGSAVALGFVCGRFVGRR